MNWWERFLAWRVGSPAQTGDKPMAQQYQGKNIRSQREARDGDEGYVKGGDQVTITLDDGSEKTVKRSEISGAASPPGQGGQGQSQR
jgi:hypothetical protein